MIVELADPAITVRGWLPSLDGLFEYDLKVNKTPEEIKAEKEYRIRAGKTTKGIKTYKTVRKTALAKDARDESIAYFLPGLWPRLKAHLDEHGIQYEIVDKRNPAIRPRPDYSVLEGVEFRTNQDVAIALLSVADCGVFETSVAWGKCQDPDTGILMYDGSARRAGDIQVGDLLMGDDATPRKVLSTCSGTDRMYEYRPACGQPHRFTQDHMLTLYCTDNTDSIVRHVQIDRELMVDIRICDYLKLPEEDRKRLRGIHLHPSGAATLMTFELVDAGEGPYAGFTLDGDQRYLLEDRTVTHNSFIISILCKVFPTLRILVTTGSSQVVKTLYQYLGQQLDYSEVGIMCGTKNTSDGKRVVVSTLRSLPKLNADLVDLVLVDESHDIGDNDAGRELMRFRFARRFGFSASPIRNDGSGLLMESIVGPTIMKVTYEQAMQAGMVTPMKYTLIPCNRAPSVCMSPTVPDVTFKRFAYWRNFYRNRAIADFVYKIRQADPECQILIMVSTLSHAIRLHQMLPGFVVAYYGASDVDQVREQFSKEEQARIDFSKYKLKQDDLGRISGAFAKGTLRSVIATMIYKQGVNFVHLQVLIRADGVSSEVMGIQVPGRLSRLDSGKDCAYLVDVNDSFCPRAAKRTRERIGQYENQHWEYVSQEEMLNDLRAKREKRDNKDTGLPVSGQDAPGEDS